MRNRINEEVSKGTVPAPLAKMLEELSNNYIGPRKLFDQYLDLVIQELKTRTTFSSYHEKDRTLETFGLNFTRPYIELENSILLGEKNLQEIEQKIQKGENVILLANHQSELDPQAIHILLEKKQTDLTHSLAFVAGHKVTTDPLAIPFSLGCNLVSIYSKNYIEHPPEEKEAKARHNTRSLKRLKTLLDQGGLCLYVAPSGGRDRPDSNGNLLPTPFHPQAVEIFQFLSKRAKKKTHLYPLALYTYPLLPPPATVQKEIGELRRMSRTAIGLNFGEEIKNQKTDTIWKTVTKLYLDLCKELP